MKKPSARTLAEMERGRQIQQLRANPPSPLQQLLSERFNPDHVSLMEVEDTDARPADEETKRYHQRLREMNKDRWGD